MEYFFFFAGKQNIIQYISKCSTLQSTSPQGIHFSHPQEIQFLKMCIQTPLEFIVILKKQPLEHQAMRSLMPSTAMASFELKTLCRFSHFMKRSIDVGMCRSAASNVAGSNET